MINAPLLIAALPLNIAWANRSANIRAVEEALKELRKDTDVVCLPELFSTGFIAEPELCHREAEPDNGPTISALKVLAQKHRIAIAGSYLSRNDDSTEFYNRGFFIEPNGESVFVNKRHLFHVSPEAQILTGGTTSYLVVRFRGWNIALGICYDLRFPVWCRNTMTRNRYAYDVFLLPANWPQARAVALEALAKARAIENQAYFVVANRSGSDEYGEYDGLSFVEDYIGTRIVTASAGEIIYATADREGLEKLRDYMPAGLDSDSFKIIY
ncbi:MAG: hypothetical protein NC301_01890 [Bacteroides sp.]|nr:hypothetical protein [Bacteroides sp.]MCM1378634.1 hypothetical protein [Bacteroides sp.]MCM1446392.1 hypothetical protein [Prevotella sp.]